MSSRDPHGPGRLVAVAGLFSAKDREYQHRVDAVAARVRDLGGEVVARIVQRRGVSDGGVQLMGAPLSRRFLLGPGRLEELATACAAEGVDVVVFVNELDAHQRQSLADRLGRPVLSAADLEGPAAAL
ncbi:hypothetical protein [Dactylosporangium sp. CS-033363]|uniref:HflX-like GTP-binding protein n=1 Tax=Dactylosporangium sp. CS-033363 TaxID=3239935 RepID=UPI003D8E08BF